MKHLLAVLLVCCSVHLTCKAEGAATTRHTAMRWLEASQRAQAQLESYGVFASYAETRIELAQARSFALLGDVANTQSRLPYADGEEPEWSSGGDGVVRMLMVSLELEAIHATLFGDLIAAGRAEDAFAYAASLGTGQADANVYLQLGQALGTDYRLADPFLAALAPKHQAQVMIGVVASLLQAQATRQAERVYRRMYQRAHQGIDKAAGANAAAEMTRLLILDNNWRTATAMLELADFDPEIKAVLVMEAIGTAARNDSMTAAARLAQAIPKTGASDALSAQLALGFAASGDTRRAGEIFDRALEGGKTRDSRMWEQVAMQTQRYDWLESYYAGIADPWRRSERFYQWAKRRLIANERQEANRLALLSRGAADEIPRSQTRWLAYRLLSEYYALAADPTAALEMTQEIPADQPAARSERLQADVQVAVAWAIAGDADKAAHRAGAISAADMRISALVMSAGHAHAQSTQAYERLLEAARRECQSLPDGERTSQAAPAEKLWASIVDMQLAAGDAAGAQATAELAASAGLAATAYESIVSSELAAGHIDKAVATAGAIPAGMDYSVGYDRQQHALGKVTATLAATGDGLGAEKLLAQISQETVRELNTSAVVRALVMQGEIERANKLVKQLTRSDARQNALAVVLFALAERRELPAPGLLNHAPRRSGGGLCWAVAASAQVDVATFDAWLAELRVAGCRAFAFAGAAYAVTAAADALQPSELFAAVDPSRMEERMALAMQRMAGGRNSR